MKKGDTARKPRGLAQAGRLFHARSGAGLITPDFYARVFIGGKRKIFNLGGDSCRAQQFDREVRARLRRGDTEVDVTRWLRTAKATNQALLVAGMAEVVVGDFPATHQPSIDATDTSQRAEAPTLPKTESTHGMACEGGPDRSTATAKRPANHILIRHYSIHQLPENQPMHCPTFRDLSNALMSVGSRLEVHPQTRHRYISSLLNLVETALFFRAGRLREKPNRSGRRVSLDDYGSTLGDQASPIVDRPVSLADHQLMNDFKTARLHGLPRGSAAEHSAKISANTEMKQARALFTDRWACLAYDRASLTLPLTVHSFLTGEKNFRCPARLPFVASPDQVRSLHREVRARARKGDRALAKVLVLALFCGMRRNEIYHSRREWVQKDAYGHCVKIVAGKKFMPKFARERDVDIPGWLAKWLLKSSDGDFIVSSDAVERRHAICRAYALLRRLKFTARKPLHSLRGLFYAYRLKTDTLPQQTLRAMGHEALRTGHTHYATRPLAKELVALWKDPLPAMGPQPQQLPLVFGEESGNG